MAEILTFNVYCSQCASRLRVFCEWKLVGSVPGQWTCPVCRRDNCVVASGTVVRVEEWHGESDERQADRGAA